MNKRARDTVRSTLGRSSRRVRRWLLGIGLAVVLVASTGFAFLRIELDGPNLGDKIASILNKRMRGRIEIGSVEWRSADLEKVLTGGWVPVTVRDVRVWDDCALGTEDPEALRLGDPNKDCTPDDRPDPDPHSRRKPRKLLLWTPEATAEIDVHAALFGNHDLVFRHVTLRGGEALIEQTREPYPLHAYNRTIVSIASAFYPRMKAGFRAGIYADSPPPVFDLRDIHIEGMNLTVHVSPSANADGTVEYGMAARLEDVDVAPRADDDGAYLYFNGADPLVQKFYVRLAAKATQGHVRVLDRGPRAAFRIPGPGETKYRWGEGRKDEYDLELRDIDLSRLAQLPTEWARGDFIANNLELAATVHTLPCGPGARPEDGATLHVTGGLIDYWDRPYDGQWSFKLTAENLGPTVRTCIKSTVGGERLGGTITLSGPFIALPRVALDLHDLDYDVPLSAREAPVRLTFASVHGWIDLVNDQGALDPSTALVRGGKEPGEVLASATFGLKPLNGQADVNIVKPIDVGRFLPAKVAAVAHFLKGRLKAGGDLEEGFEIRDFDVALGATPTDTVAQLRGGRIFAQHDFDEIAFQRIQFQAGRSTALINGGLVYTNGQYEYRNLRIDGEYRDLDVWLRRFDLPPIASSAGGGTIVLNGPISAPTITARTTLKGVPCLGTLEVVDATIKDKIADLRVASPGLGGSLTGTALVDLNPAVPYIQRLHLTGSRLDGAKVCGLNGVVKGTIDSLAADLHGSIDKNRSAIDWASLASVYAVAQHASVYGDGYSNISLCLNRSQADDDKLCRRTPVPDAARSRCEDAKHGGACVVASAQRDQGGALDATIANAPVRRGRGGKELAGIIKLEDVPMAVLAPFVGNGKIGGLFSASLDLSGQLQPMLAPQASGAIELLRSWVANAFTGDVQLRVDPVRVGNLRGVLVRGEAMSGRLELSATIGTEAPYPVDVAITGRRVEIDQFVDLGKRLPFGEPVQAWASGTVTLHTELAPRSGKPAAPEAWVEITELEAILDHESRDGRHVPLRFELVPGAPGQYAMSLRVTPTTVELACRKADAPGGRVPCPAQLETPAGIVAIEGQATATSMHLTATGALDVGKLAPLLENEVDNIAGVLQLQGEITGTVARPSYAVELAITKPITVRPAGTDTDLEVENGGELKIANGSLGFNQLAIQVKGEQSEAGELHVRGAIGLDGLHPNKWAVLVDGTIAGKLLPALTSKISQATGLATIDGDLVLTGTGAWPLVRGSITFDPEPGTQHAPLSFVPRGVRHELAITRGSVDIDTTDTGGHRTYKIDLDEDAPLTVMIDGVGRFDRVRGEVALEDGAPADADVHLDADNVPMHIPGTLDLTLAAQDIELRLRNGQWRVSGGLAIVGGAYRANFDVTDAIKPSPPTIAPPRPWWDEYPSVGNAELRLVLDVHRFSVDDNIAKIDLQGRSIAISGTPRDPRLTGSIIVAGRGEFQIPLTRAHFTRTTGTIDFSPSDPATDPHLEFSSQDPEYHDLSGQQHVINLHIYGTLQQPLWDLSTNTGLDKSQTLDLIFLGQNPESLRRSLGDQAIGTDPTRVDPTTNPSTGFADQLVKDIAGDWISSLFGPTLNHLGGLDVLRFGVSFGAVSVHAEYKAFENARIIGDAEQTIRGQSINGRIDVHLPYHVPFGWRTYLNDRLSVQGSLLSKTYTDPADQALNISDVQGKAVYRMFIP